jgi:predicted nucleic acid-binding protein
VGNAQVIDPVTAASAPIAGAGHNYIGTGAEVVNPADGSVLFHLPIKPPAGRMLSLTFGITYNSMTPFYISGNGESPYFNWQTSNVSTAPPFENYGWSMRFLLDMNALVALGFIHHEFHDRVAAWVMDSKSVILTSSITELGFVRVLAQAPSYGVSVSDARALLSRLKRNKVCPFSFVPDGQDITKLPLWVKSSKQTTDGHLVELARANGALLATLDEKIPGAHPIT